MKTSIIEQLKTFTQNIDDSKNILTEQENETLLTLLRKCVAPSREYSVSSTDKEAELTKTFVNTIDDNFGEEPADALSTMCTDIAIVLSTLIADELVLMIKEAGIDHPTDDMIIDAMESVNTKNGLPPSFLSKPPLLASFLIQTIEDPLVAMINSSKCLEVGEKLSGDIIRMSALRMQTAAMK